MSAPVRDPAVPQTDGTNFLNLAPIHSSPPSSPTTTKATAVLPQVSTPAAAPIIEPVEKTKRSDSASSAKSTDSTFLSLNEE